LKDSLDFLSRQDQGAMPSRARENGKKEKGNSDKEGKKSKPSSIEGKRKKRSKSSRPGKTKVFTSSLRENQVERGTKKRNAKFNENREKNNKKRRLEETNILTTAQIEEWVSGGSAILSEPSKKSKMFSDVDIHNICMEAIINRKTMDGTAAITAAIGSSGIDIDAMRKTDLDVIFDSYRKLITELGNEAVELYLEDQNKFFPIELIEDIDKPDYQNPDEIERDRRKAAKAEEIDEMETKEEYKEPDTEDPIDEDFGLEPLFNSMETTDRALEQAQEQLRVQKLKEAHISAKEFKNMKKEEQDEDLSEVTDVLDKFTFKPSPVTVKVFNLMKKEAKALRAMSEASANHKLSFVGPGAIGMTNLKEIIKDSIEKVMAPADIVRLLSSLLTALKEYKDKLPKTKDTIDPNYSDGNIDAITEQVNTLWAYGHDNYPRFFFIGEESDAEFVKRTEALLARRKMLYESLTPDIAAEKVAKIQLEITSIQNTLDANEEKYNAIADQIYDIDYEAEATEQLHNFPKDTYDVPYFKELEVKFHENNKKLKDIVKSMRAELSKKVPDPTKIEVLRNDWENIYNSGYIKEYTDERDRQGDIKVQNVNEFRQEVSESFDKLVSTIANKLFKVHMEGEVYTVIDRLGEIFNEYYSIREKLSKDKQNREEFKEADGKWATKIQIELQRLNQKIDTLSHPIRDEQKIITDINMRAKYMEDLMKKQKDFQNKEGLIYSPERHEKDAYTNLIQSEKNVRAEFSAKEMYKVLTKDFPKNYPDAVMRLESEVINLKTAIREDISSFGPFLHQVVNQMYDRFRSQIQNVNAQDRARFDAAIESEKKFLQKIVTKEAYSRTGAKLLNATKDGRLQKYVLDPTTFSEHDKEAMMMYTPVGLYMSETRRLLDLVTQSMDLRKRMVKDVHKTLNMEGNPDAVKFDVVLSNLFPPSQVELKMRYLLTLPPDERKKYDNGRFIQAIKMMDPTFDITSVGNDNFLEAVSTIGQSSKSFLQDIVGATPISWSDFESMGNELVRSQAAILSQVRDKPVDNDTEVGQNQRAPTDSFGYDQDAGAQNTESGLRVNSTFNPATQGQITRDKIDDEKRSQYIQMVGSMLGTFLEASEDEPYVPMHPAASKFYFSGDNYKNLKNQYQSMRPLIPKNSMPDPNTYIEEMVSYYGPILGIKNRKSTFQDHPAYIQKEALELQELVNSFQNYTTATAGNYVHAQQVEGGPQSIPQQQQQPQSEEAKTQINPTSTGEEETDPFRAGLQSAFDNSSDMGNNFNIFDAGPNWAPVPGSSLQASLQK